MRKKYEKKKNFASAYSLKKESDPLVRGIRIRIKKSRISNTDRYFVTGWGRDRETAEEETAGDCSHGPAAA
jgi:hypothetical protein